MISDVLVSVRVAAAGDKLTRCHWLERTMESRPGTRRAWFTQRTTNTLR